MYIVYTMIKRLLIKYSKITDKETTHSYGEVYDALFESVKDTARNILEIGINKGGSLLTWSEYFDKAIIHGIDLLPAPKMLNNIHNIKTYIHDAYNEKFIKDTFKNIKFDIIIDDGPHTLDSMIFVVKEYINLLTDNGILVIEDIQNIKWIDILKSNVPKDIDKFVSFIDRRNIKGRYDDILFIINKKYK